MSKNDVFVYGSLMSVRVLRILLGREPMIAPGRISGFWRFPVKDQAYPAIVPHENNEVRGLVIHDLSDLELERFDKFEDDDYDRKVVPVTKDDNVTVEAHVYIWRRGKDLLLEGEWHYDRDFIPRKDTYCINVQKFVDAGYSWDW